MTLKKPRHKGASFRVDRSRCQTAAAAASAFTGKLQVAQAFYIKSCPQLESPGPLKVTKATRKTAGAGAHAGNFNLSDLNHDPHRDCQCGIVGESEL